MVSDCSWDYAACLMNPFDGPIACLPDAYAVPSSRVRTRKIVPVVIGTGGYGSILLNPIVAMLGDVDSIFSTTSAFTGTGFAVSGTGIAASKIGTNMFNAADWAVTLNQFRAVAYGIRLTYTGTVLNCNGQLICVESPDHTDLTATNWGDWTARPGVDVQPVATGKQYVARSSGPKQPSERQYCATVTAAQLTVGPHLGILIEAASGTTFSAEVSIVYEFVGKQNQMPLPAKQDSVGFEHVNGVLNSLGPQGFQTAKDVTIWQRLLSGVLPAAKAALQMSAALSSPAASAVFSALRQPGLGILPSSRIFG